MRMLLQATSFSLIGFLTLASQVSAEELAPPDVSLYADVMFSMAQTKNLTFHGDDGIGSYHHGNTDGYRARVGLKLNELSHGFWSYGLEGSLVQLANDDTTSSYERAPQTHIDVSNNNIYKVAVNGEHSLELSGFELAGRIWYDDTLYVRAGALMYNEKTKLRTVRTFYDATGNEMLRPTTTAETDTKRRFAPMLGIGIQYPIIQGVYLAGEYSFYRMNSQQIDVLSAGVRLVF